MLLSIEGKSLMKIIEMVYCSNFTLLRFTTESHHPKKTKTVEPLYCGHLGDLVKCSVYWCPFRRVPLY